MDLSRKSKPENLVDGAAFRDGLQSATGLAASRIMLLHHEVDENQDYHAKVAKVQRVLDGYPGLYRDLLTYLKERIKDLSEAVKAFEADTAA